MIYSLLVSLILHVAVVLILPLFADRQQSDREPPTIVRLVEPPIPEKKPSPPEKPGLEIDQQPALQPPPEPVDSKRKAVRDQKVAKEQAPEGDDVRDQTTARPQPPARPVIPPPAARPPRPVEPAPKQQQSAPLAGENLAKAEPQPITPPEATVPQQPPESAPPPPLLTPDQLFPDRQDLDRLLGASPGDRNRIKKRDDVEIGDTIWLNLSHDLLVSFFRRFHDQVERVWNYPAEAAQSGIEGTLELMITVNREGELLDVDLRRSSGSDLLDFEAIQAIYRAAPFGPLTRHYPHDKLNIRAYFRYSIVGKYIYGRQRG